MQPFTALSSNVIPLDRANVDTDQIIPKQFLKSVLRSGLGRGLFYDWRYRADGTPDETFVLNQPRYRGARILLARENFGCGSSREHAPWALKDYGILCILAPSFADIFYNNCCKNGMLPARLAPGDIDRLFQRAAAGLRLEVDLEAQTVRDTAGGWAAEFTLEPFRKQCLLEGRDDIALTLRHESAIDAWERTHAPRPRGAAQP